MGKCLSHSNKGTGVKAERSGDKHRENIVVGTPKLHWVLYLKEGIVK